VVWKGNSEGSLEGGTGWESKSRERSINPQSAREQKRNEKYQFSLGKRKDPKSQGLEKKSNLLPEERKLLLEKKGKT